MQSGFPLHQKVMFAPHLRDNLVSVGRVCDEALTCVFNTCGSKVFLNKGLKISGTEVHSEMRDRHTGMYPLTLSSPDTFGFSASTNFLDEMGNLGDLASIAHAILQRIRTRDVKPLVPKVIPPESIMEDTIALLTRVYVREDLDEANRWHAKCGHVSMKYLKRLGIKSLEGKKKKIT